jgi:DNA-binding transcriptional MerR regulator
VVGTTSGQVGTAFTVEGRGFLSEENNISVFFGNLNLANVQCNKDGSFNYSGTVPQIPGDVYQITARNSHGDTIFASSSSSYFVIKQTVMLEPDTGHVGMQINLKGTGFKSKTYINLSWDSIIVSETIAETDDYGIFQGAFIVPTCNNGVHNIIISDGINNEEATWIMESVPPPMLLPLFPSNGVRIGHLGGQKPTFTWTAVQDLSGVLYNLSIARDEQFTNVILSKEYLSTNTYALTQTESLRKGLYFWRVKAIDGAGNESQWTNPTTIQIGSNLFLWLFGILIPLLLVGLAILSQFKIGFTSKKRKQIAEARNNTKIKKQAQLEEDKKQQEYLEQLRGQILEMARKNRGGLTIETIMTSIKINLETLQNCLKKMNVKREGERIFFPDIEKGLKK